jgi:hypothetical protein
LPYPHPGQRTIRREARRFNWLAAGRRWRKTTLVMSIAVEAALRGTPIVWGAPTYDQVRVGWDEARKAAGTVAKFNQSDMQAQFPSGGRIVFRSLDDPDNARGHTAGGVVIDESADVSERAWYEVLRPMLIDTDGWAWCIGTPKSRNWFWREHVRAADRADSRAWQVPTLGVRLTAQGLVRAPHPLENPAIPFAEIQQMAATMPERTFRQEILAEFIEDTGGVFRRVTERATLPGLLEPNPQRQTVMGVDWGKSQDFTVLVVVDVTTGHVVGFDRFNQIDWAVQRERLRALWGQWRCGVILAERNSIGDPNIEALQRDGLPVQGFTTTNSTKTQAIEALSLAIETGQTQYPPLPPLLDELHAYEMTRLPSGATRYSAPEGLHDDCVIAFALAWHAAHGGTAAPLEGAMVDLLAGFRGI